MKMKKCLLVSFVVLAVLAVTAGLLGSQLGRVQSRHNVQIAGDGTGPIPTCRPGTNCKPDDDLRQIAGDGTGPIPTCRPGTNCKPDDELRQIAAQAADVRVQLEGLFGSNERFLAELS